jgi:hypothetical protein
MAGFPEGLPEGRSSCPGSLHPVENIPSIMCGVVCFGTQEEFLWHQQMRKFRFFTFVKLRLKRIPERTDRYSDTGLSQKKRNMLTYLKKTYKLEA